MFRIRSLSSLAYVLAGTVVLSACGGGGSHGTLPAIPSQALTPGTPVDSASATFVFTFPKDSSSSNARKTASLRSPKYLSSATKSISLQVTDTKNSSSNADIYANVPAALKAVQSANFANLTGNGSIAGQCGTDPSNAGNYMCTAKFQLPVGINTLTLASWDANGGTGNKLSQNIATVTTLQGVANGPGGAYTISLDANAAAMAVTATSGFCAGSFTVANSGNVATVGTTPVTFNATYTDPATKTIVAPGLPTLTVNGHTDDNGGAGYTDSTTHLNVKVNQSAQTFTLTQTAGTGNAAVTVAATPHSGSDGLSFNQTLSFTFQSGAAPPASFLADAQQIINGSGVVTGGQINFYTLTLGGSDSFSAFSPATLSISNGDVDFPNDLLFDTNGDLMIANGGAGSPDFGNFACVPAGSITTGANNATVLTNNMDDPASMALGTDSSVALLNKGNSPTDLMAEFVLNGTYTAASATRDVAQSSYSGDGAHQNVVALPATAANPSGSYAMAFTNGTQAGTHIIIKHPDGSVAEFPQDASDVFPYLTYDAANNQIVAANQNGTASHITFWSVSTMTKVKDFVMENDGSGNSQVAAAGPIAASADGHIAIIVAGASGFPELLIYDNSANRNKVGGVLDYGATTASCGATFVYGGTVSANSANKLIWLNNTKLLVNLYSQHSHVATSANGMYIYDITQTMAQSGFDGNCNAEQTPVVKQTAFQSLSNAPYSAAYKP